MKYRQWEDAEAPARPRYDVEDPKLSAMIDEFLRDLEPYPDLDLVREILVTGVKLAGDETSRGDAKILRTAIKELRHAFRVFAPYGDVRKVSIFGSARTQPGSREYEMAVELGREMARAGFMVITGAGDGIMGAGHLGAGRECSFGLNILLPFEQVPNKTIAKDAKLINFHYFFTRKLFFVKESEAIVLMPGGFGTMDEGFETLTLMQTGKAEIVPLLMLEPPGGTYWTRWRDFVSGSLLEGGYVSRDDGALFKITTGVEEVCTEIHRFYHRYHSSRYVDYKRTLVMRLSKPLPDGRLDELNEAFADILVDGRIEICDPFPEETDEPELADLPRLKMAFNQKQFSRLRQLIDAVNADFEPQRR